MSFARITAAALLFIAVALPAAAQPAVESLPQLPPRAAPTSDIQVGSLPVMDTTPAFDAQAATKAYLAKVSGEARAKSDAYYEGGYVLQLVDLLYALGIAGLLLWLQISTRIRDWVEERTHSRSYQVMLYAAIYVALTTAAAFPLALYEGYFREHAYGLSNQSLTLWLGDFGIQFAITLVTMVLFLPVLYAVMRRARETWWIWGAGLAILFQVLMLVIYPVFIAPLFNQYTPLPDSAVKTRILSLARANHVPAENVWLVDASRQSNRISANVSGFLGTTRIALTDNLLKQGSADEVLAVMGHEIGHYAMGHTTRLLLMMGLVTVVGFAFVNWAFLIACDIFGGQWQVRKITDVAGLPLLAALSAIFFFLATPVTNSISRTTEFQADLFGLNAVRKPDAFATVMLKLSTYRKLEPGRWEEAVFFTHPSGRTRIETAMRWKKEHIADADIRRTATLP
jgi:STE24 endopeptidase